MSGIIGAIVLAAVMAGCSSGVCAGGSIPAGPALTFTAKAWFAANPATTVKICLNSTCKSFAASTDGVPTDWPIHITTGKQGERSAAVSVVMLKGAERIGSATAKVTMTEDPCTPNPCGCAIRTRSASAELTGTGQLKIG